LEAALSSRDDETAVDGRGFPREPVPIKAWTEGPCEFFSSVSLVFQDGTDLRRVAPSDGHEKYLGEDHNTLVLVAGGSGVSYTLSNSLDIVRRARAMHLGSDSKKLSVATKRLHFLWMVKKPEQVEWIGEAHFFYSSLFSLLYIIPSELTASLRFQTGDHLRAMCLAAPPGLLQITLFITGKRQANEAPVLEGFVTDDRRDSPPADSEKKDEPSSTPSSPPASTKGKVEHGSTVVLRSGRPDFREIVATELKETAYEE